MASYKKLLEGYRAFRADYLGDQNTAWRNWAKDGQSPRTMVIACSDSRVNPVIITRAGLGDIFMVNNVANLVPPYEEDADSYHGTSAAIEYAVTQLKVEHIIVMGHSGCGGIRALIDAQDSSPDEGGEFSFIRPWMEIVEAAADFTAQEKSTCDIEARATICEQRAGLISLNNLAGFPWVKAAMKAGKLHIHAWHFDIGSGILQEYNPATEGFEELV